MALNKKKWTQEVTKILVNLYELQPVLYKVNSPDYHNKTLKTKAYETIKIELESFYKESFQVDEITKKINNLRTQFLEVEKNRKKIIPSESCGDAKNVPSWWLYTELLFLLPFCKRDKGVCNLQVLNIVSPTSNEIEKEASDEENESTNDWGSVIEAEEQQSNTQLNITEADIIITEDLLSPSSVTDVENWTPIQRKKKRKRDENDANQAIVQAIEKVASSPNKSSLSEKIQSFCDFVGHELKNIKNKKILKQCKWEIQTIIHQKQEEDEDF